jgi:hypothetical protein
MGLEWHPRRVRFPDERRHHGVDTAAATHRGFRAFAIVFGL